MAARITDILPLLLITLLCVAIVEGGYQALEYFVLKTPVKQPAILDTVPVVKDSTGREKQKKKLDYHIILQRNLFGPPPGKDQPVAAVTEDYAENLKSTSLDIVLMGTINGGEGADRAIVLDKKSRKQELYEKGDAIQGAFVKEILRGKVILDYNGKDEMLDMSEAANVRPSYAVPVKKTATRKKRASVSSQGTPRRVKNRPRVIRPSRSIRRE